MGNRILFQFTEIAKIYFRRFGALFEDGTRRKSDDVGNLCYDNIIDEREMRLK